MVRSLATYLGYEMGDLSDLFSLGLISVTVFSIYGFTDMASNTAGTIHADVDAFDCAPEPEGVQFR